MGVTDVLAADLGRVSPSWDRVVEWLLGPGVLVLATLVIAAVVRWLMHRLITRVVAAMTSRSVRALPQSGRAGRVLATATGLAHERHVQRTATLGSLLKSVVSVVVVTLAVLTIMALIGLPLGPVLASAGVGGVALGFGAQSLVKDFLSGIFMILEDQYGVGDLIDTGEVVGTVEEVTLRVTRLVDSAGVTWYVRNGEIIRIGNKSQGVATATIDVPLSYEADVQAALETIRDAVHQMDQAPAWTDRLVEEPSVLGVESMSGGVVTVRVLARCAPGDQFAIAREVRERVKLALDAAGVPAPPVTPFGGPGAGAGAGAGRSGR